GDLAGPGYRASPSREQSVREQVSSTCPNESQIPSSRQGFVSSLGGVFPAFYIQDFRLRMA
ncbi:hypothetical protein ACI2J4_22400, partial [Agrobacterium tumefaciens]|uniref:hypothetical protein n=1 Tax=Agrobacterium tumefaciens TaxID=358 RepID=UPI00384BC281